MVCGLISGPSGSFLGWSIGNFMTRQQPTCYCSRSINYQLFFQVIILFEKASQQHLVHITSRWHCVNNVAILRLCVESLESFISLLVAAKVDEFNAERPFQKVKATDLGNRAHELVQK